MRRIILGWFLLLPVPLLAQMGEVTGTLSDSSAMKKLDNAVISFLDPADSSLIQFVRTDKNGSFKAKVPAGNYLMLVTYPTYAEFVTEVEIKSRQNKFLDNIYLTPKIKILQEVLIAQRPIRIKGDTTEYIIDSFKFKQNASVSDLLKTLEGIQVDKDGKITAQGKTVQKILVDGEEFFSDDPSIITQNLLAKDVKKVQVFDKKSDQAEFTGIDDGKKTKTINLELKEEAKHGYFGQATAAALDKYYNFQGMVNAFSAKRKLSVFGIASSTSQTGLEWSNAANYGFSVGNVEVNDETGVTIVSGKNEDGLGAGSYSGNGLPVSIKAGLHYDNKWNRDKFRVNGNYLFNQLETRSKINDFTQYILKDSAYFTREETNVKKNNLRNSISGSLELLPDSTSSVKLSFNGYAGNFNSVSNGKLSSLSEGNSLINQSGSKTNYKGDDQVEIINLLYRKKLGRKGNTFSFNINQAYSKKNSTGFLLNGASFFNPGGSLNHIDSVNQKKLNTAEVSQLALLATYTQSLTQSSFLIFNLGLTNYHSNSNLSSYNFNQVANDYNMVVDSLTNHFKYTYWIQSGGVNYKLVLKKMNFSIGGSVSGTSFTQNNLKTDTLGKRSYFNVYPRADLLYKFSSASNLTIQYKGSTLQPTIDQIQPLADNRDPMNIIIGNQKLRPSFQQNLDITYTSFQALGSRYLVLGTSFTLTDDEIGNSYFTDNQGRRVTQFINTSDNYVAGLYGIFNTQIAKSAWRFGTGPVFWVYQYTNFINGNKNKTINENLTWRFTLTGRKAGAFDLNITAQPGLRVAKSAISKVSDMQYRIGTFSVAGSVELPGKFELGSDVNLSLRQKTTVFDTNNNLYLWNAYLEKRLLKSENLVARFSVFDIMNQDKGYDRFEFGNGISEQRYLTLGQYGMLQLSYNFRNKTTKGPVDHGAIQL